jgi:hypothetical protein
MNTQAVFRDPCVVAQARGAIVTGARCDLREAFSHGRDPSRILNASIVRYVGRCHVSVATAGKNAGHAGAHVVKCPVRNSKEPDPMTVKKRRRLPNFEACSVALFAALTITGGSSAARAQSTATATRTTNPAHRAPISREEYDHSLVRLNWGVIEHRSRRLS